MDDFCRFCTSESTLKDLEGLKQLLTFNELEEPESDPAWNNLSTAAHRQRINNNQIPIKSEIAQHIVDR